MNIIGLGQCGCNIAEKFEQYPQYKTFYINTEESGSKNFFLLDKQESHQEYEENKTLQYCLYCPMLNCCPKPPIFKTGLFSLFCKSMQDLVFLTRLC